MKRREFITLLAAISAWPCALSAQILRERPLVGILIEGRPTISPLTALPTVSGFLQGMVEVGYVDGRDFDLDFRVANGDYARLPMLAEELVSLKPSVLMTATVAGTLAIRKATNAIPIVHPSLTDPIGFGFIASLARPGGQVTGLLATLDTLPGKQLQLALELLPGVTTVGVLLNASNP